MDEIGKVVSSSEVYGSNSTKMIWWTWF